MLIAQIENAIIDRLKSVISDLSIEPFPDKPEEYKLKHNKGAVLVCYGGSHFSEIKTTDRVVQDRRMEFDLVIVMRNLRGHSGVYTYLDLIKKVLTGYKIFGGKLYPIREEFVNEELGQWQYRITFALTVPFVEVDDDEETALLKKITTLDEYGTIIVKEAL